MTAASEEGQASEWSKGNPVKVGLIQSALEAYRESHPKKGFMIFQALLAASLIAPMGIWRFTIEEYPQGIFDLTLSIIFVVIAYIGSKDQYFHLVSRIFAISYTLGVLITIQYTGIIGLFWSYAATVAVFFSARRWEAILVAIVIYLTCIHAVWDIAEPQLLFTYSACFLLITFFCFNFSTRLLADNSRLSQEALQDALTGLGNRRSLDDHINKIANTDDPPGVAYSLIMFDLDHFKQINDSYGHTTGDLVLARLADLIKSKVPSDVRVYRYGGEEFLILTPTDLDQASLLAERLRQLVEQSKIIRELSTPITISLGVAQKQKGANYRSWLKAADDALYRAKATGRNKVCTALSEDSVPPSWRK